MSNLPTRNFQDKITYYFGAGASANAIPMVGQINERLISFENFWGTVSRGVVNGYPEWIDFNYRSELNSFQAFSKKWISLIQESPSIDTLAKRLSDQNNYEDYLSYKSFLTVLFNFFHYTRLKPDPQDHGKKVLTFTHSLEGRYENLIRSINHFSMATHYPFFIPGNFNFISWNYNFQLEMTAYQDKSEKPDLSKAVADKKNILGINLTNLNGSSLIPKEVIDLETTPTDKILAELLLSIYVRLKKSPENNPLKFSWEAGRDHNMETLRCIAEQSKYVVVIGYSFPTFNRDIDNAFFHNLNQETRVFTQGYDFADSQRIERYLRQTFNSNRRKGENDNIEPFFKIYPVESPFFYVPAEYFLERKSYSRSTPIQLRKH